MGFHFYTMILTLSLQVISFFTNGLVLYVFYRKPSLRSNTNHQLILLLSIADWLYALCSIPGMSYLIANWSPTNVHYDPYITVYSNSPLIFEYKVNLTLTVAVALDRCLAILLPFWYHQRKGSYFSMVVLGIGLFLGLMDFLVLIEFGDIHDVPGCTAAGCFVSSFARKCMGYSNMALGSTVAILTLIIIVKLKLFKGSHNLESLGSQNQRRFSQANRSRLRHSPDISQLLHDSQLPNRRGRDFHETPHYFCNYWPILHHRLGLDRDCERDHLLTLNNDALQVVGKVLSMNLGENKSNQNTVHSIPRPLEQENSKSSVKKKTSVNNVKLVWTAP